MIRRSLHASEGLPGSAPTGAGGAGEGVERWTVTLRDRAGAVERVLGVLRKRMVRVEGLRLERASPRAMVLELHLEPDPHRRARIGSELRGLVDVEGVSQNGTLT